jgi:hypothetical protein
MYMVIFTPELSEFTPPFTQYITKNVPHPFHDVLINNFVTVFNYKYNMVVKSESAVVKGF